jgi:hypothetical protein
MSGVVAEPTPDRFREHKYKRSKEALYDYDKDMLAIMPELAKFRQYLVGGYFVVRTDHNRLRYFLEQWDLNERKINE